MGRFSSLAAASVLGLVVLVGAVPAAAAEPAADGVIKYAINQPSVAWNAYGPGQTNAAIKDKAVIGGHAVRVQVTTPTPDKPWSIAAGQPVQGKIAKGDIVTIAFWARAEPVDGGPATADIGGVRIQQVEAPWGGIVEGSVQVTGPEWKIYSVTAHAALDADKGQAGVSLNLGGSKQTVVLGPLFVLNFGPNYPAALGK